MQKMDPSLWCIVITTGILFPPNVAAYANGLVTAACADMMPQHNYTSQNISAPYTLTVSKTTYSAGEKIIVTLKNTSADYPIEGFFIQARHQYNDTPLGSFHITGNTVQTLKCTTDASAVSHTSDREKSVVQVTWVAPDSNYSDIELRATVVRNLSIFWTDIVSSSITYAGVSHVLASLPVMCITMVFCFLVSPQS